jgi:hypothetical protein
MLALDLHTSEATKVVVSAQGIGSANQLALIIGNGSYPDAAEPLNQPINDANGLAYAMRRHGFDVDVVEDATKADMARAVERLKSRIKPGHSHAQGETAFPVRYRSRHSC